MAFFRSRLHGLPVDVAVNALHGVVDPAGDLFYDWAVITLAKLSPTVGALAGALNEEYPVMLLSGYQLQVSLPDCNHFATSANALVELGEDVGAALPYLNAVLPAARYAPNVPCA